MRARTALLEALTPPCEMLSNASSQHSAKANPLYAVGGTIRDVLLGRPIIDVDLAIEGDAIDAMRVAMPNARVTAHARFGTATA